MHYKLASIERRIIDAIERGMKKVSNTDSSTLWTTAMKKALTNLGYCKKYKVHSSLEKTKEWLYDLCWTKGRIGRDFTSLSLIAEIEWLTDQEDILRDFQKLTVGVANYRLLIIYYYENGKKYNQAWADNIARSCKKLCPKGYGFRYLILKLHYSNGKPKIDIEHWKV